MHSRRVIYRIIDANLNRASEGLRVIEDGVRFILDDRSFTEELKRLRHSLVKIVKETPLFSREELISSRNSQRDVGAELPEEKREQIKEMIRANFKRVEEAERSLEEFGKLLSPLMGEQFKEIRFKTYSLEKKVEMRLYKKGDFSLHIITSSNLIKEENRERKIKEIISNGATVIQLREKNLPLRGFLKIALSMRKIIKPPIVFIINDRVDIAIACQADGVHIGQEDMPLPMARQILGEHKIIGLSTHSVKQAQKAEKEGADYIAIGPIFATSSKAKAGPAKGTQIISQVKEMIKIPLVAIGGINLDNIDKTLEAGADGIAVINAVFQEADVGSATRGLSEKIRKCSEQGTNAT